MFDDIIQLLSWSAKQLLEILHHFSWLFRLWCLIVIHRRRSPKSFRFFQITTLCLL